MSTGSPKCPECGVRGIEHIVSEESVERSRNREPWFFVVHCKQCGHVYNVIAKHVISNAGVPRFVFPKPD